METEQLLTERGKTHGEYSVHAKATWKIKLILRDYNFQTMKPIQKEALDMIAHKIGRILAGNPDFVDHWDDIAGYAKLVADRLR